MLDPFSVRCGRRGWWLSNEPRLPGLCGGSLGSPFAAVAHRWRAILDGSAGSGVLCQPFVAQGYYSEITSALTVGGLVGCDLSLLSKFLQCFRIPVHLA